MTGRPAFLAAATAIVLLAAWLRFWSLDVGLPHPMTRPDEEAILASTAALGRGDPRLGWAIYPHGYLYLTWACGAAGLRLGEAVGAWPHTSYATALREHPERLLLADRALSAAAGTATVALLIAAARPALGAGGALVAGLVLATNLLHVRDSHGAKPDTLFTLGVVAALAAMVPLARRATLTAALGVGVVVGLAMAMKQPALLLLAPAYVAAVAGTAQRGWRRLLPGTVVVAGVAALAAFAATSPYMLLDPAVRARTLSVLGTVFPGLFPQLVTPELPSGLAALRQEQPTTSAFVYHARFSLWYGAGVLPTLLAPAALAWGFVSRAPLVRLAAVFGAVYYLANGVSPAMLARYMTPLVPVLALLEAGLLVALARRAGGARTIAVGAILLVGQSLAASVAFDRVASAVDTRLAATAWLGANVPAGARLAILGTRFWPYGEPVVPAGIEVVRPKQGEELPVGVSYVLTHEHPVFASRVDPVALAGLRPRLELVEDIDPFVRGGPTPVFEYFDAYYIPIAGFSGVSRPGPHIRIYRVTGAREQAS